jgi:integrase
MARFNFNLRTANSKTDTPIHLIIRWNCNKITYPTGISINPKFWDFKNQYAKQSRKFHGYSEFNTILDNIENKAKDVFRMFLNDNQLKEPTKKEYKDLLDVNFSKKAIVEVNLIDFISLFMEQSKTRISKTGKPISPATIRIYRNVRDRLIEFQEKKKYRIDFDTIDLNFYYSFLEFLTIDKDYTTNTIGKYIRNLKTIMYEALERKLTENDTFKSNKFIADSEEVDSIYLGYDVLDELFALDLKKKPMLDNARDLFLVYCFTGLRYEDVTTLKYEQVQGETISLRMHKTQEKVVVPFNHKITKSIRDKYKDVTTHSLPRIISNAKLNLYIKEVCSLIPSLQLEIELTKTKGGKEFILKQEKYKFVTVHTARRSFATNLMLDEIPVPSIMRVTGHKTESAFWKYIKIEAKDSIKSITKLYGNK